MPLSHARPGLDAKERATLARLATPERIQAFVDALPINHEIGGETVLSVREVLRQRRAHCIEAAFVAACALWVHRQPPLVMHLDCDPADWPHVVALFRRGRGWGAISKSNHIGLRYRDPVYRSLRELAMSYFHEYCDRRGRRTLVSYTNAFDLRRLDPRRLGDRGGSVLVGPRSPRGATPHAARHPAAAGCALAPRPVRAQARGGPAASAAGPGEAIARVLRIARGR